MTRVRIETTSAVTRAGLEALLASRPEIEIVDSASEADVVLSEALEISESSAPIVPIVLLGDVTPHEGLRAGARAVLGRDASPAQIAAALQAAAAGLIAVPAHDSGALAPPLAEESAEPLTPRELDVLEMLAEGLSNKMIAYRLSISEHTAKFHVNSILAKLNSGTRTEAVMRGVRLGLVKL
ncbi:MAG TPA: response regulator transcription factor [Bryobacteraceae bacterium]